ncbi:hypothetical protein NEOLEDRAFT_1156051 [Neolentinus lepideus HHB14362 ss-1]|uniref:Uncharacterized protein n=1 Tax=Neolentinus lepideus HHB14362 ss-1 TaxID=1314782 RepID=A0A165SZK6_9AGAM|nr:hypothetical protein NEOLEDRAFT_1156051 [Neolentinus lepideus HHB14362 ss-1]
MYSKSSAAFVILSLFTLSEPVLGRYRWMERDNRAVILNPRRFGQEHPAVIDKLSSACPGQVCGVLAGQAITPLLAAQGECTQQDMADSIIDAAQQFDNATKTNMIALAVEYRQAEKNTPPDFTTNPPTNRNSVFCQTAPKNAELNGLVQAQDPANDPNIFFDPNGSKSVTKGSQANTFPFGTNSSAVTGSSAAASTSTAAISSSAAASAATSSAASSATSSAADVSATNSAADAASTGTSCAVVTVTSTITATATDGATASSASVVATSSAAAASSTAAASSIGNFGSCSIPQIEFGVGFDNRKETSFQPTDKTSYNHGSADNGDIVTQFMCDTLVNTCNADATAKATCAQAKVAFDSKTAKTGAQADAFNAVFGITTNFATVQPLDDQGNPVGAVSSSAAATTSAASATSAVSSAAAATVTSAAAATASSSAASTGSSSGIGNFGSCSVPQIEFGVGFDNRKETSFQPTDKTSYNHGSADNGDIVTQFMCDTLVNSCNADATAKATCAQAKVAFDSKTAKTGAQADAFNAVFGITTNFATVQPLDDQGNPVGAVSSSAAAAATTAAASTAAVVATSAAATISSAAAAASSSAASTGSSSGIGNFGSCSVPQIEFGVGFDNRKETSFQPTDKASYNHGSADNGDIITQFMCDNLVNSCGADATAKATCAQAKVAFDSKTAKTGAQADAFNAVFGITTNFAAIQPLDDQGNAVN